MLKTMRRSGRGGDGERREKAEREVGAKQEVRKIERSLKGWVGKGKREGMREGIMEKGRAKVREKVEKKGNPYPPQTPRMTSRLHQTYPFRRVHGE